MENENILTNSLLDRAAAASFFRQKINNSIVMPGACPQSAYEIRIPDSGMRRCRMVLGMCAKSSRERIMWCVVRWSAASETASLSSRGS